MNVAICVVAANCTFCGTFIDLLQKQSFAFIILPPLLAIFHGHRMTLDVLCCVKL